jgi:hypothetical protein
MVIAVSIPSISVFFFTYRAYSGRSPIYASLRIPSVLQDRFAAHIIHLPPFRCFPSLSAPFNTPQIRSITSSQVKSRHINAFHLPNPPLSTFYPA